MFDKHIKAILLGYSGHGFVVAEAAILQNVELLGYAESTSVEKNPYNLSYLGDETKTDFDWSKSDFYILGVGSNAIREKIFLRIREKAAEALTVIHPDASVSKNSVIGEGTIVARNAAVNPLVTVGKGTILNTSSSVDHECIIEDFVHIAPGAVLAGNVRVKKNSFVGANSVIKEGITIGENAIVGAGSVVLRNVPDNAVVLGNPAKIIR